MAELESEPWFVSLAKFMLPPLHHMAFLLKPGRIQAFLLSAHRSSRLGNDRQSLLGIDGFLPSLPRLG